MVQNNLFANVDWAGMGERHRQRDLTNRLAQPLQQGDYGGAANIAFEAGRPELGLQMQDRAREMARADALAARQEDEQFRNFYGETTDLYGRVAGLMKRGLITPEQAPAAYAKIDAMQRAKYGSDARYTDALDAINQQAASVQYNPDVILPYSEEYAQGVFEAADPLKQAGAEVERGRLELDKQKFGLEQQKFAEELRKATEQAPADLNDVLKVRDRFDKVAKPFEEAQRQYNTMSALAQDATGASDVALGFAFFKTIDPASTVREGEFAQAASAMGLGGRVVALFARLDRGEKFTPELRQELVQAASRAYEEQKADMIAAQERTLAFAQRHNLNPEDVMRDVVRGPVGGNEAGDNDPPPPPGVTTPTVSPPEGIDDQDWAYMTPEERALFQ